MRQRLVIAALILSAVLLAAWFLATTGVPNVVGSGQAFTERSSVSTLRTIHWAQGSLRRAAYLDSDGDGVGEFGSMEQLAGEAALSSGAPLPTSLLPLAGNTIEGGILHAHGYCFRIDLPEGADARERRFVAFAWPRIEAAGLKAYCIDQNEDILETANVGGWVGCESAPPAGSCPEAAATDAPGSTWSRWRGKTSQTRVGAAD